MRLSESPSSPKHDGAAERGASALHKAY